MRIQQVEPVVCSTRIVLCTTTKYPLCEFRCRATKPHCVCQVCVWVCRRSFKVGGGGDCAAEGWLLATTTHTQTDTTKPVTMQLAVRNGRVVVLTRSSLLCQMTYCSSITQNAYHSITIYMRFQWTQEHMYKEKHLRNSQIYTAVTISFWD